MTRAEKMCVESGNGECDAKLRRFNRYLVIDAGTDGAYRIRGIRSDAPSDMIEEFVGWYRDRTRYKNGRLRPKDVVKKTCVIQV